jgi:TonB family protein
MKKIFITVLLFAFSMYLFSQEETTIKYYKNFSLKKETKESKAKYKLVLKKNEHITNEDLFRIDDNKIIWHKSYHNEKPYGTWYYYYDKNIIIDSIVYGSNKPQGFYSYDVESMKLEQNTEGKFTEPRMLDIDENIYSIANKNNVPDFIVWIAETINYPDDAKINGISGEVRAQFTIDENGEIGNIRIIEGVDIILDIELYKLLKSMPRMQPAKLNGETIKLFIEVSTNFRMY